MREVTPAVLPTFVIGLREGLEAALIVGIVAAFLGRRGRRDALRQMWIGVGIAVAICFVIAVVLQLVSQSLPQRQQEGLETVIGSLAVAMVTYMVIWMRRHAREIKGHLEGAAAQALAHGSAAGLVAMAFLAVLREGFETSVFLLAVFQGSGNALLAGIGAVAGVAVALVLGYGIYRGGVRINMGRFFRTTGLVLVVVAAGLVVTSLHTAHEAGWINVGQGSAFDISWLVRPGTIVASLLTGVLGLQPFPTTIEVIGWVLYAVPLLLYVGWPQSGMRPTARVRHAVAGQALLVATLLTFMSACGGGETSGRSGQASRTATTVVVTLTPDGCPPQPATVPAGPVTFHVTNKDAGGVTEAEVMQSGRILGEKENLTPGLSGSFSLSLDEGRYEMYCPGAKTDTWPLEVTASGASTPAGLSTALAQAVGGYREYVVAQAARLEEETRRFAAAVKAEDISLAKSLYAPARFYYEQIEPVAESFGDLDPAIDARVDDVADPAEWTGFHRLEKALWVDGSLAGMARSRTSSSGTSRGFRRSSPRRHTSPLSWAMARPSCWERLSRARSPARRSATATPTCWTSRPTSWGRRRHSISSIPR